jgi:hypothetical protein
MKRDACHSRANDNSVFGNALFLSLILYENSISLPTFFNILILGCVVNSLNK